MQSQTGVVSKVAVVIGWVLGILPALMMIAGFVYSMLKSQEAREGFVHYGYSEASFYPLLAVEMVCVLLYLVPRTAVLGAILLTGYLGGATATHVRAGEPQFFMPVVVGIVYWLGLFLRDRRVRALVPLRT